jgi:DNA-binding NtrC family response regulator
LRLDPACDEALSARPWRGNVRELANALERAAILAHGDTLHPSAFELADGVAGTLAPAASAAAQTAGTLAELEKQAIEASLARHEGNRKLVAEELDLPVRTLYDKIKRHGLG